MEQRIRIAGRYFRPALSTLIRALHKAGLESRKKTRAERVVGLIDSSLTRDFHRFFRPKEHGYDAASVARRFRETLAQNVESEKRRQEAEYLRGTVSACQEYVREAETRLSTLEGESGPVLLLERMREIREAKAKMIQDGGNVA